MYIKTTSGSPEPYSIGKLRRDNKNVSFPKNIPDATLAAYDVYRVTIPSEPTYNNLTQRLSLGDIIEQEGQWIRPWNIVELTEEEIAANNSTNANQLRIKRDQLLAETDWTALSDVTMTDEMATYRQALRDITSHENWPNLSDDDWPTKP